MPENNSGLPDRLEEATSELNALSGLLNENRDQVSRIADRVISAINSGHTIFFMGNGGSAAEAQHFAAEFVGHMRRDRRPLPAIALTTDTSIITAISNDHDFDQIFARQITALCSSGDVVVGLSGSGNSTNIINGLAAAREKKVVTIACTGSAPNKMVEMADLSIAIPTASTPRAQEIHLLLWHTICEMIDDSLLDDNS